FPSDFFTVADASTDTGRRVAFQRESLPANVSGVHIDPSEWNRSDGFSPGAQIMLRVPGLDPARSGLPPITDLSRSLDSESPIALLDAASGEGVLCFAELDAHASEDAKRALLVHPAVSLREGHRHVVALRRLVDSTGSTIEASDVFRAYRDRL